jgi:hypothetical protein
MKKLIVALLALLVVGVTPADAATPVVRITDKPHTNFEGAFRDNELAQLITPEGKLGKVVFNSSSAKKTWVIDPALIDDIANMADGYSVQGKEDEVGQAAAQNWLSQLKFVTVSHPVIALPYGNPDQSLAKRLAPSELRLYSKYGKDRLELQLGRPVLSQNGWSKGKSRLSYPLQAQYSKNRKLLTGLSTLSSADEIIALRARLGTVMNPLLNTDDRTYFSDSAVRAVQLMTSKLRVTSGRYQLTSSSAKLPVTLVNSFDTPTVVSVSLIPLNSRMMVQNVNNVTLAANSRQQISIEVDVIAPGSTVVVAQLINSEGRLVGEQSRLSLTATIIDSRVAWFTTGAAALLFLGAVTQSVRRVRRSRK